MRSDFDDIFVEEDTTTEAERAAERAYWQQLRDIDRAADAQVAEIEAEALLAQYDDDPSPYAGNWSEE
ncbi:hypothetical protein [Armatimonas rosea]|uniref:Uncharacterized protein n=1 Tax=Armatimonas rosea TaxID=685828 RepID=A0A7W9SUW9_ARMRO|nr:hypothetical protein [Armatimonas rosea]MBB6053300.1 hypothetical protein [Armatimonas rosea]